MGAFVRTGKISADTKIPDSIPTPKTYLPGSRVAFVDPQTVVIEFQDPQDAKKTVRVGISIRSAATYTEVDDAWEALRPKVVAGEHQSV